MGTMSTLVTSNPLPYSSEAEASCYHFFSVMALSSWLSRLRSSSKPIYSNYKNSFLHKQNTLLSRTLIVGSENSKKQFQSSWSIPLLLMAMAASACSLSVQLQNNEGPTFFDAPNTNQM
ncbi:D-lactate dehydrogenase [cytochrome] [Abeliophyllum distichum]|uniref:D-lactate dehydrogenase [cytochrome] n=1 Tax=Abeliophyllum distichum TaxID=126358 RepID=A0ABD1PT08_9LAMI